MIAVLDAIIIAEEIVIMTAMTISEEAVTLTTTTTSEEAVTSTMTTIVEETAISTMTTIVEEAAISIMLTILIVIGEGCAMKTEIADATTMNPVLSRVLMQDLLTIRIVGATINNSKKLPFLLVDVRKGQC